MNGSNGHLLICDDDYDTTSMPSGPWSYSSSNLGSDLPTPNSLLFGNSGNSHYDTNAASDYQAAAYLMNAYYLAGYASASPSPGPTPAQNQAAVDYNQAIWNIFNRSLSMTSTQSNLQAAAFSFVNDSGNSSFMATLDQHVTVYTPTASTEGGNASTGQQEFLELGGGPVTVPEPTTLLLVPGACLVGLLVRKRLRRA